MPPYQRGSFNLSAYDFTATSNPLRMMLCTTDYSYDADHDTVDDGTTSDPASYEIGVGGYSRQDLANIVRFVNDTNDHAGLDCDDVTFSSLSAGATVGHAIVYRYTTAGTTGNAATTGDTGQELVGDYPVTATPTNGGDITIQIADSSDGGLFQLVSTS